MAYNDFVDYSDLFVPDSEVEELFESFNFANDNEGYSVYPEWGFEVNQGPTSNISHGLVDPAMLESDRGFETAMMDIEPGTDAIDGEEVNTVGPEDERPAGVKKTRKPAIDHTRSKLLVREASEWTEPTFPDGHRGQDRKQGPITMKSFHEFLGKDEYHCTTSPSLKRDSARQYARILKHMGFDLTEDNRVTRIFGLIPANNIPKRLGQVLKAHKYDKSFYNGILDRLETRFMKRNKGKSAREVFTALTGTDIEHEFGIKAPKAKEASKDDDRSAAASNSEDDELMAETNIAAGTPLQTSNDSAMPGQALPFPENPAKAPGIARYEKKKAANAGKTTSGEASGAEKGTEAPPRKKRKTAKVAGKKAEKTNSGIGAIAENLVNSGPEHGEFDLQNELLKLDLPTEQIDQIKGIFGRAMIEVLKVVKK